MNIIEHGKQFEIFEDEIKTHKELPLQTYRVNFDPMSGYSLVKVDNFYITEKIYGKNTDKLDKIMDSYKLFERSMGIILSGDKGIGKSLFTKLLSQRALKEGYPVLIVNKETPNLSDFLDSIDQECLVLFDEFEKVFSEQDKLLSLFDGYSTKKKLYAITINHVNKLSEFMVNRPGRFHYHFRFSYPSPQEVREYLEDKVDSKYKEQIDKAVLLSKRMKLNYDYLRAIAFELNTGTALKNALQDLNIINTDEGQSYTLTAKAKGDDKVYTDKVYLNLLDEKEVFDATFSAKPDKVGKEFYDLEVDSLELDYTKLEELNNGLIIRNPEHRLSEVQVKKDLISDWETINNDVKIEYIIMEPAVQKDEYAIKV